LLRASDFFEQVIFSTVMFNDDEHFAFTTDTEGEFKVRALILKHAASVQKPSPTHNKLYIEYRSKNSLTLK
jgi:hypothetical protein